MIESPSVFFISLAWLARSLLGPIGQVGVATPAGVNIITWIFLPTFSVAFHFSLKFSENIPIYIMKRDYSL
jgi:hypothetical protein